jgi:hypothetical protein
MLLGMVPDLSSIEQRRRWCKFFEVVMRLSARDAPWRKQLSGNFSEIQVRMLRGEPSGFTINYVRLEPVFYGRNLRKSMPLLLLEAMVIIA